MFKKMLPTFSSQSPTGIPLFRVFGANRRPSSVQKQRKASFFDQSKERCELQSTGAPGQAVGGAAFEDSLRRGAGPRRNSRESCAAAEFSRVWRSCSRSQCRVQPLGPQLAAAILNYSVVSELLCGVLGASVRVTGS